jgi:hypothetical protein
MALFQLVPRGVGDGSPSDATAAPPTRVPRVRVLTGIGAERGGR